MPASDLDFGNFNFQPGDFEYKYINDINFKSVISPWFSKRSTSSTNILDITSTIFFNALRTVLYNVVFAGLTIFGQSSRNYFFATAAKNFYGLNKITLAQKFTFLFAYLHILNIIPIDYITGNGDDCNHDNNEQQEEHKLLNTANSSKSSNFGSRLAETLMMEKKSTKLKDSRKRKQDGPVEAANADNGAEIEAIKSRDSKKQKNAYEKIVLAGVSGGDSPEESTGRKNEEKDLKRKDSPEVDGKASSTRSSKRAKKAEEEDSTQGKDSNEIHASNDDPTPMDLDPKDLKRKATLVKNEEETPASAKPNKKSKSNSSSEHAAGREVKGKKRHESSTQNGADKSHKKQKSTHDESEKSSKRKEAAAADKVQPNDSKKHKTEHASEEASAAKKESRRDRKKRKIADAQLPDRYDENEKEDDGAEGKEEEDEDEGGEKGESGSKPTPKGPFKVFIGNIPFTATAESLKAHLQSLSPASIRLPMLESDPTKAKGFAFVEFHHPAQMKKCLLTFHNTLFEGRKIRVELSAGGGGNSQTRKSKIAERNSKLDEQRKRRHDEAADEKEAKKARRAEQEAADSAQMHPSRQRRIKK